MKAKRHLRLAALIAGGVAISLAGCSGHDDTAAAEAQPPLPAAVARVTMADAADVFEAGGVVQARTTATLAARILAPVLEVRVAPGDRVRTGQVLVVLDGRDLGAQARGARASAAAADQGILAAAAERKSAAAGLALARATHERISGLHAKRSATAQELDDATAALRAAEARAASADARAQAAVSGREGARAVSDAAGTAASFARITAPFDGIVTDKMVEPGNMASPGTPLVRIEDTRGFRLDVRVDESRIGQIAVGAVVAVSVDGGADGAAASVDGTVSEVGRAVDADARAFLVKISLPDAPGLRSGRFGRAYFNGPPRRALTVPAGAVTRRGQISSVFVVDNGVARLRMVSVRGTEVLAGLSEGEIVVVNPPAALSDGRRVGGEGR